MNQPIVVNLDWLCDRVRVCADVWADHGFDRLALREMRALADLRDTLVREVGEEATQALLLQVMTRGDWS